MRCNKEIQGMNNGINCLNLNTILVENCFNLENLIFTLCQHQMKGYLIQISKNCCNYAIQTECTWYLWKSRK